MQTQDSANGLRQLIPTTAVEIEMTRRVLMSMTDRPVADGVYCQIGDYLGDGWYELYVIKPDTQADQDGSVDLDEVFAELATAMPIPSSIKGRICLLEREYPASEYYRLALRWQYQGDAEYSGGDGPITNGAVLLARQ